MLRTCGAAAAVALLVASIGAVGSSAPVSAANSRCAAFTFIGLRGNGEAYSKGSPVKEMGKEAAAVFSALSAQAPFKGRITYVGVPAQQAAAKAYESGYLTSLQSAGTALAAFMPTYDKQLNCKVPTRYILVGYSQGAYEIRAGLQVLSKNNKQASIVKRITATVLIADPARASTGVLRIAQSGVTSRTIRTALQWTQETCYQVSALPWPYPDCSLAGYIDVKSSRFAQYRKIGRLVTDEDPTSPTYKAVLGVVVYRGVLAGVISEALAGWTKLGQATIAPMPSRPTYSYDVAGDGISRAVEVLAQEFAPAVDGARGIYEDPNYPGARYTDTVNALDEAFSTLDEAEKVQNSYASSPLMAQTIATWLLRTVK